MLEAAPERLAKSVSMDGPLSEWSLDCASFLLREAGDPQFERLMRSVEASPETRASRWLEYGEEEWIPDFSVEPGPHKDVLDAIGFEARGNVSGSLERAEEAGYEPLMGEGYQSPEATFETAMALPLRQRSKWLRAAALEGHPAAQYELAIALAALDGGCTGQSMGWVICSAVSGYPEACSAVSFCAIARPDLLGLAGAGLSHGDAMKLMRYAASRGERTAAANISAMCSTGACGAPSRFLESIGMTGVPYPGHLSEDRPRNAPAGPPSAEADRGSPIAAAHRQKPILSGGRRR